MCSHLKVLQQCIVREWVWNDVFTIGDDHILEMSHYEFHCSQYMYQREDIRDNLFVFKSPGL